MFCCRIDDVLGGRRLVGALKPSQRFRIVALLMADDPERTIKAFIHSRVVLQEQQNFRSLW